MKGLIIKDLMVIGNQLKMFLILAIILFCSSSNTGALVWLLGAMLPLTSISYDDQAKWTNLAIMMPLSRKQIVLSKYLLGLIGLGCAIILSIVVYFAFSLFGFSRFENFQTQVFSFCAGVLLISIQLPLMFKFGAEKARIASLILVGATCGFLSTISMINSGRMLWILNQLPLLFCITIGLFLLSMWLSIKIFENKE